MSNLFLVLAGVSLLASGGLSTVSRGPADGRAVAAGAVTVVLIVVLSALFRLSVGNQTLASAILAAGTALFAGAGAKRAKEEGLTEATLASVAAAVGLLSLLANSMLV
ncbi:hypothetical protein [Haloarchaeobius sp. TZWWS8]|uniref:hypothetical protein n=1 Tax=Haloarchaeobius sp. TZWWS8 TaxID=3446121 RepID=UPI003EB9D43A